MINITKHVITKYLNSCFMFYKITYIMPCKNGWEYKYYNIEHLIEEIYQKGSLYDLVPRAKSLNDKIIKLAKERAKTWWKPKFPMNAYFLFNHEIDRYSLKKMLHKRYPNGLPINRTHSTGITTWTISQQKGLAWSIMSKSKKNYTKLML